ncbi:MAG: hypothetical protein HQL35_08210 [Alphaproteobacteria bacterium]|nr:hypothetical protein [Alphaproteobacteria bacterium]
MASLFSLLCHVCGLSQRESAAFLDAREDTIKSWSSGRRQAPDGVIGQLAELADAIDAAADRLVAAVADNAPPGDGVIELGVASDDAEAQSIGWPCVGAHRAALGLAVARGMAEGYTFAIVPRGSTVATAAAADVHDLHQ